MKGGISMSNLNDDFGFKDYPGLYACGELLDVTEPVVVTICILPLQVLMLLQEE